MSFELITSSLYWLLFSLWLVILFLYLLNLRKHHLFGGAVSVLLVILAIDAFRTVFESAYFGSYFTSLYGFISPDIYNLLSKPEFLIVPKLVNLVAACLVLFLLIRHWLPKHSFERQKLIHDISESEKQLRLAIQNSPLPTLIHSEDGRILMASQAVYDITGYQPEEIDTVEKWVNLAYRDRADEMAKLIANGYDGSQSFLGEFTIHTRDDQQRIWSFNISPLGYDRHGNLLRFAVANDVTEARRLEAIRNVEADVLEAVTSNHSLDAILTQVVLGIESLMPDAMASVLLLDSSGKFIMSVTAPNLPADYNQAIVGEPIGPNAGSCGTAAYRKQTVIVSDIATDPLWKDYKTLALAHDLLACWSQPVFDDANNVIATFAVYHRNIRSPSQADQDTIRRIANIIAVAIMKKRSEQKLQDSEQRFRKIFEQAATGVALSTPTGQFVHVNQAYCKMLGYSETELKKRDVQSLIHPDERQQNLEDIRQLLEGEQESKIFEKRYLHKSGDTVWARMSFSVQRDGDGQPQFLVAITEDITESKLSAQRQSEVERTFSQLLSNLSGFAYRCLLDEHWTMVYLSDAFETITGYPPDEVINNRKIDYDTITHPDDRARVTAQIHDAVANARNFQVEYRIIKKDGEECWVLEQGSDVRDEQGNVIAVEGYITDITQEKQVDALIRQSEQRFQLLSKATNDAIWDWDIQTDTLWWNEGFAGLFGYPEEEIEPTIEFWAQHVHPDEREKIVNSLDKAVADKAISWQANYRFVRKDGSIAHVMDRGYVIYDELTGEAIRMVGGITDITERLHLEEQLRQSQRLESVGQLTGGVAHDFNNLLTVIIGNADIIHQSLPDDSNLRGLAAMIEEAAGRGAELTSSLLAFARRQPLDPKNIDVNALLNGLQTLLVRALGEEIRCEYVLADKLWLAQVDPGQLENAILNLTLNARDAMPDGGKLMIETENLHLTQDYAQRHDVSAGDYVMVAVSDSGHGIAAAQLDKVFEPFYTTKTKEKGTGLGLAMVYGFIKQSHGHINIYSEVGQGTTVRLYLPKATDSIDELNHISEQKQLPAGNEHILVVEDDALVREYVVSQLELLGYQVHTAVDGHAALALLAQDIEVDLLFTDVVMPNGLSGRELADAARQQRPGLRVLYTSGYTENSIVHHGRLDSGVLLLSKPYSRDELAKKIRQALMHTT